MKTVGHRDVKTAMHYQHPELYVVRAALDHGVVSETAEMRVERRIPEKPQPRRLHSKSRTLARANRLAHDPSAHERIPRAGGRRPKTGTGPREG
jgi:hypothetical protein